MPGIMQPDWLAHRLTRPAFATSVVSVHRVGNVPGDRCSAIELSCEMAGAVVRTDTDKNAALCSAPSTSPMTRSTMKLSRIISRAERAR